MATEVGAGPVANGDPLTVVKAPLERSMLKAEILASV